MAVTLADVQKAIDQLEKQGQKPTQRAVRAMTGGDTGAVGVMINQILNARKQLGSQAIQSAGPAPLPQYVQTVVDQAKATIEQIAQEAVAAANQAVQSERDQMQQEMDQIGQDRDDAQQENIRFRQEIDDLNKQVADQASEISRLKSDLAAANQAKIDLQAERDQARKDLAKAQDDLKAARDQATKDVQTHAEDIRKLNDDLAKQKVDAAALQQTLKDQQVALNQAQTGMKAAQDAAQESALHAARLEAENKGLAKSEKGLQAEITRLNGLLESINQDIARRTQELLELREKHARADQAREDAEKMVAMVEDARKQLAEQLAEWRQRGEGAEPTGKGQGASPVSPVSKSRKTTSS